MNISVSNEISLRPMKAEDLEAVFEYGRDESINMMLFFPHSTIEESKALVEMAVREWKEDVPKDREYVILYKGKIVGGIDLEYPVDDGTYEIGWVIHKDYRNKGIASLCAKSLIEYAFDELGAKKIIAHCDARNMASQAVMKKIGMSLANAKGTRTYPRTGEIAQEYEFELKK